MKYLLALIAAAALALTMPGCQTSLDPAGAYQGDNWLYQTDKAVTTAYDTIDGFLIWELQYRSSLATNAPHVTAAADSIRSQAPRWFAVEKQMRGLYVAAKSPGTSNQLFNAAAVITTGATNATQLRSSIKL